MPNNTQVQQRQSNFPPTISFPENKVGPTTKIAHSCYIGHNTVIGNYCTIASNVSIAPPEHSTHYLSTSSEFYNLHYQNGVHQKSSADDPFIFEEYKGCNIGNDVWIDKNAVIMDGVTIKDGAVICANSTVIHDVPAYAIVCGAPAKIIKYRFSPEIIERLVEIRWWELPNDMLNNLPHNIESALNTLEQRVKHK